MQSDLDNIQVRLQVLAHQVPAQVMTATPVSVQPHQQLMIASLQSTQAGLSCLTGLLLAQLVPAAADQAAELASVRPHQPPVSAQVPRSHQLMKASLQSTQVELLCPTGLHLPQVVPAAQVLADPPPVNVQVPQPCLLTCLLLAQLVSAAQSQRLMIKKLKSMCTIPMGRLQHKVQHATFCLRILSFVRLLNLESLVAVQHLLMFLTVWHVACCGKAFFVHTERTVKVQQKQSQGDDAEQAIDDTSEAVQDGIDQVAEGKSQSCANTSIHDNTLGSNCILHISPVALLHGTGRQKRPCMAAVILLVAYSSLPLSLANLTWLHPSAFCNITACILQRSSTSLLHTKSC